MMYILIPVYNESLNLGELHGRLTALPISNDCTFVFVDDCSTDDSVAKIKSLFKREQLHIIEKKQNRGPGDSFNLGFEYILSVSTSTQDLVISMEADNTSDLGILPEMLSLSDYGYNLILASVYAQGGGFEKTNVFRVLISFVANMLMRMVFGVKVLTLSSFYRVYSVELLRNIKSNFGTINKEPGFICMLEILLKAIDCKAKIIEVPMLLKSENRKGKSKMKVFKTFRAYIRFLLFFKRNKKA
jgi:dolichol-phosphate mannosyltransferase